MTEMVGNGKPGGNGKLARSNGNGQRGNGQGARSGSFKAGPPELPDNYIPSDPGEDDIPF